MRRLLILLVLFLLSTSVLAEAPTVPDAPLTLPSCTSAAEVQEFLLMPSKFNLADVVPGYIRYIGQDHTRDDMFRTGYWLGGEKGSVLDLTLTERSGVKFPFYSGVMCSRAAYSMALSYLGIDMTPGGMSALMNTRNLDDPYDDVSQKLGVERIVVSDDKFNTMMQNYLTDESYSPVYLFFRRPSGSTHVVLVVATIPDKGRFLVLDPNPPQAGGKLYRVYFISLNKARSEIINSTFSEHLKGSKVLDVCQWRLPADTALTAE